MAYVGGRSSYLPGQKIFLPLNVCCDEHPEVRAIARIVGETDSFGFEAMDMCQECYDNFKTQDTLIEGICDWCKSSDKDLKYKRDSDEGTSGRVYQVCESCIKAQREKDNSEVEDTDNFIDSDDSVYPDDDFDFDVSDKPD